MTTPGEFSSNDGDKPERIVFRPESPGFRFEAQDNDTLQLAEFYVPGIIRLATRSVDPAGKVGVTVVDLRELALSLNSGLHKDPAYLARVALGKQLLSGVVDFSKIPAGYPEIEAVALAAMERPRVPLPDLVPGLHYLYVQHLRSSFDRFGLIRAFKHGTLTSESKQIQEDRLYVWRAFESKFGPYGHLGFSHKDGWAPTYPSPLTGSMKDISLVTHAGDSPESLAYEYFHELSMKEVNEISNLRPVVMAPDIRFSSDNDQA